MSGTTSIRALTGSPPRRSHRDRRGSLAGLLLVSPATAVVVLFFVVPFGLTIWMSLNDWSLFGSHTYVGAANYREVARDSVFWHALAFTSLYTLLTTIAIFVLAFALALFLRRQRPGVGIIRTAVFLPVVTGMAAGSLLWSSLYAPKSGLLPKLLSDLHLVKNPGSPFTAQWPALLAVILVVVWKTTGLTMILLLVGMQAIPSDIYEAAALDGCGPFRTFRSITLPLMRRSLALALVLSVTGSYLAFDQFYILTRGGPGTSTLTVVADIYRVAFVQYRLGYATALAVVLLVLLAVLNTMQLSILRREK